MSWKFHFKRKHEFFAYGASHAVLIAIGMEIEAREGWLFILPLMAAISFYAWVAALKRQRAIGDTPTSLIASAAQGYVELRGRAENHRDSPLFAPHSKTGCCWYRYTIEERDSDGDWRTVEDEQSSASFVLRDESGEACTVDVAAAEVVCTDNESWESGGRRYTEWLFVEGDSIYALGEFITRSYAPTAEQAREEVGELLMEWKQDPADLNARFDLDKDGNISDQEWQLARVAAKRDVEHRHDELRKLPSVHLLGKPADGRIFLVSDHAPDKLQARFGWWMWGQLAVLFITLGVLVFVVI